MDEVFGAYFQRLIEKVDQASLRSIQIASRAGEILAKTKTNDEEYIPAEIIRAVIQELDIKNSRQIIYNNSGEYTVVATPLVVDSQLLAVIFIESVNLKHCEQIITIIRTSLETYIEHQQAGKEAASETSREEAIIKELLAARQDDWEKPAISYKLFKSLKSLGIDLFLLRSVILVELEKKANIYFNINLDLGYELSAEAFKDKGVQVLKANKYLNSQDIVAFFDSDHIVIVKSFLDVGNIRKLYQALDNICQGIMSDLEAAKIFTYRIAYGGIYSNFYDLRKSYSEAENTIRLGAIFQESPGIYNVDQGLLEHVGYYLPPIIKHKVVQAVLSSLKKADGGIDFDLLHIAEEFVDQGLNLMQTARMLHMHRNTVSQKIEKFRKKTGLDPENNFKDAFIIKMAAISVKIEAIGQDKI